MSKKKQSYSPEEEEHNSRLEEPMAAYGLDADHLRMDMMREALNIEDTSLLKDALEYIRNLVVKAHRPPAQFTLEELKEVLAESERDRQAGRVICHEDIPKYFPEWGLKRK